MELDFDKLWKNLQGVGGLLSLFTASLAFLLVWWKKFSYFLSTVGHAAGLAETFGENPAEKIKTALLNLQRAQSIAEIERQLFSKHLNLGTYVCSPDGQCTAVNQTLVELFGLSREQFIGFGWTEAIIPEDRLKTIEVWKRSVAERSAYDATYTVYNRITKTKRRMRTHAYSVLDIETKVLLCYVGFVIPIDD